MNWDAISAALPAEARQFALANGFAGKPGSCLTLPAADGKIAQVLFGLEDAGGQVAGERGAIRAGDGFAIQVGKVGVGAAEGHAQAAFDKGLGDNGGVFDGLGLELFELVGLGDLESQRQPAKDVDVRAALFTGKSPAQLHMTFIGEGTLVEDAENYVLAKSGGNTEAADSPKRRCAAATLAFPSRQLRR